MSTATVFSEVGCNAGSNSYSGDEMNSDYDADEYDEDFFEKKKDSLFDDGSRSSRKRCSDVLGGVIDDEFRRRRGGGGNGGMNNFISAKNLLPKHSAVSCVLVAIQEMDKRVFQTLAY